MISFQSCSCYGPLQRWEKICNLASTPLMVIFGRRYSIELIEKNGVKSHRFRKKKYSTTKKVLSLISLPFSFPFAIVGCYQTRKFTHHRMHSSLLHSLFFDRNRNTISNYESIPIKPDLSNLKKAEEAFTSADSRLQTKLTELEKSYFKNLKKRIGNPEQNDGEIYQQFFTKLFQDGTCFGVCIHLLEILLERKNGEKISAHYLKEKVQNQQIFYLQYLENLRGDLFYKFPEMKGLQQYKPFLVDTPWENTIFFQKTKPLFVESFTLLKGTKKKKMQEKIESLIQRANRKESFVTIDFLYMKTQKLVPVHIMAFYLFQPNKEYLWVDSNIFFTHCEKTFHSSLASRLIYKYGSSEPTLKFSFYKRLPSEES